MRSLGSVLLLSSAFLVHLTFAQKYKSDSWAKIQAAGTGTLYVVYPKQQTGLIENKGGQIKGLCVDVLQDFVDYVQFTHKKNIKIQYAPKEIRFSDFLTVVQNNDNVLGVGSVAITDERKKILKYTPVFLYNKVAIVTHKEVPTVNKMSLLPKTLKGYSADMLTSSSNVAYIKKIKREHWPSLTMVYSESYDDIINKILSKSKTFTIVNLTRFIDLNRRHLSVKRHPIDLGDYSAKAFIMSKKSDWDEIWAEFLTEEYLAGPKYRKNVLVNLGAAFLSITGKSK